MPRYERGQTVIEPPDLEPPTSEAPDDAPGPWAGAPSALVVDRTTWLAYRLAAPGQRGYANVLARSDEGLSFETVFELRKERFDAMSLERPALVVTPEGLWRLYVSCATPGTKHWRVDVLEAATPGGLADAPSHTVLPGDVDGLAVKDPVLLHAGDRWHLWASCHPLDDRMTTRYATSPDGITWHWEGTVLHGREGAWDARGARVTAVVFDDFKATALYDGRATAEENWEERTGAAVSRVDRGVDGILKFGEFTAQGTAPAAASPHGSGGLRYVAVVEQPRGGHRLYYEAASVGGSHELRTEHVT